MCNFSTWTGDKYDCPLVSTYIVLLGTRGWCSTAKVGQGRVVKVQTDVEKEIFPLWWQLKYYAYSSSCAEQRRNPSATLTLHTYTLHGTYSNGIRSGRSDMTEGTTAKEELLKVQLVLMWGRWRGWRVLTKEEQKKWVKHMKLTTYSMRNRSLSIPLCLCEASSFAVTTENNGT